MKLTDIAPVEKWKELEKDIHKRSGLDAYVYNTQGMSITDFKEWANKLCPAIKETDKGLAFICAVANQNLANEAVKKKGPVIGECDAGLLKIAVPVFVDDAFLGVVGGCGHMIDHSEVECFLVHKMTDMDEPKIERLSRDVKRISNDEATRLIRYIQARINGIVREFANKSQ
jgi:ligand-binding sensor protein